MEWLTEQIHEEGSDGSQRNFKKKLFVDRTKANAHLMRAAQESQREDSGKPTAQVAQRHSIRHVPISVAHTDITSQEATEEAIADICQPAYLQNGYAVLINVSLLYGSNHIDANGTQHRTGDTHGEHVVSFYRDLRGQLFFFDANAGVYRILNLVEFIHAWVEGYKNGRNDLVRINQSNSHTFFASL